MQHEMNNTHVAKDYRLRHLLLGYRRVWPASKANWDLYCSKVSSACCLPSKGAHWLRTPLSSTASTHGSNVRCGLSATTLRLSSLLYLLQGGYAIVHSDTTFSHGAYHRQLLVFCSFGEVVVRRHPLQPELERCTLSAVTGEVQQKQIG